MKPRLLFLSTLFAFLSLTLLATKKADAIGGCNFLVSCQNGSVPYITSATLLCTNNVNHDPTGAWARGYWDTEITCCENDVVTITLSDCATNGSNHVLRLRSIPPNGAEWVDYGNTGNGSYKTRFEIHHYCSSTYAYSFGANIMEWFCNPE
jgi:hypothetical protein